MQHERYGTTVQDAGTGAPAELGCAPNEEGGHVSTRVLRGDRKAPRLLVKYQCPECFYTFARDAYDGPPSCLGGGQSGKHKPQFCVPMAIVHDKVANPLADIEKMRTTARDAYT